MVDQVIPLNGFARRLREIRAGEFAEEMISSAAASALGSGALTAVGHAIAVPMAGMSLATFGFSGTYGASTVQIEQSFDSTNGVDGTWYPTIAARIDTNAVAAAHALTANATAAIDVSAPNSTYVRARVTAIASGSIAAQAMASAAPVEPAPAIGTAILGATGATTLASPSSSSTVTPPPNMLKVISVASAAAVVVKASVTKLIAYSFANQAASWRWVHFYNTGSATTGSTTPLVTVGVPPGGSVTYAGPYAPNFSTAMSYSVTTGYADTDAVAGAVGDVVGFIEYA